MALVIIFIYIAIIPIILIFCKSVGIDDRFIEGEECLERSYENTMDTKR